MCFQSPPIKTEQSEDRCLRLPNFNPCLLFRSSSFSGVELQFLPCLPGAHTVRRGAELPAAASGRRQQPDLARRPRPEDSAHTHRQTAAAARHRGHPGTRHLSIREPKSGAEECFGGGCGLKALAFLVGLHH